MTKELAQLVAAHPLLTGLPGDAVANVAACARNVAFSPGDLLLAEGDIADTFYLVRRGRVAIEVHSPGRGQIVIETVGPDAVVGWSWLVPPYQWHFDARAVGSVGAVAIDGACLRQKAEADPALGYALMKRVTTILLDRLQMTRLRVLDLYGADDVR
jgi:CRP/FNR family cyclic AMP-dependent transcriptional regulator